MCRCKRWSAPAATPSGLFYGLACYGRRPPKFGRRNVARGRGIAKQIRRIASRALAHRDRPEVIADPFETARLGRLLDQYLLAGADADVELNVALLGILGRGGRGVAELQHAADDAGQGGEGFANASVGGLAVGEDVGKFD